ncbi:MAG: hypothetical protein IPJ74_11625 [Saprospiraceae bacterium]|nr:hypothetical protein [Saprospiraceae bacterium]
MSTSIIRFANIILAALLAGTSFGIWIGFNPKNYSYSTYLEQQQNLVLSLNTLMVSLVVIATFVTLVSAYLQRKNKRKFCMLHYHIKIWQSAHTKRNDDVDNRFYT